MLPHPPARYTAHPVSLNVTTDPSSRISSFRIVVLLVMFVNLILTVALVTQMREIQQRVGSLPPDPATRRDVAALRPLPIRQILRQNCVACHTARRLAVTLSMEPAEIQHTIERMLVLIWPRS